MDWFKTIKYFYDKKLWNKGQVWDAVQMGKITHDRYTEITGDDYQEERPIE